MVKAIPNQQAASDGSEVKVRENGEPLVVLNSDGRMVVFSKAFRDGKLGAIEQSLVRASVHERLAQAAEQLPKGYQLVVWETYTPRSLHESLRGKKLTVEEMAGISHMTGGAVDVSLADEHGRLLEMGTELNHGAPENKSTFYFEELEKNGVMLSGTDKEIQKNRRILYDAMAKAGFVNNPLAWFHWDYGNVWWANAVGEDAFYGAVID